MNNNFEDFEQNSQSIESRNRFESFIYITKIFKSLGQQERVLIRTFYILDTFQKFPEKFFTRKEIERIVLPRITEHNVSDLSLDFQRLIANNILIKRGIKYHLSSIGSHVLFTIKAIRNELDQNIMNQFNRSMLNKYLYEDQGLNIHSYRHVIQIGTILKGIISDIIDKESSLEWIPFLNKFEKILEDLDEYSKNFEDDLAIFNILIKIKSELLYEFSKLHKANEFALTKEFSLITKGFFPEEVNVYINYFNENDWQEIERCFHPFLENSIEIIDENDLLDLLITEYSLSDENDDNVKKEVFLDIKNIVESDDDVIQDFLPDYINLSKKINEIPLSFPLLLSEIIENLKFDREESIYFIGFIPTLISEYPIVIAPVNKLIDKKEYVVTEGILDTENRIEGNKN